MSPSSESEGLKVLPQPGAGGLLAQAPGWRRKPYQVLFPLGFVLAWAGVVHWLLHGLGVLPDYRPVFHSIVQIQGFMMCFAAGFLLTAIPRRTGTAPPAPWQMFLVIVGPIGTTIAAWFELWALSQMFWIVLVAVLIGFAVRRFISSQAARRPPNSFVWVPLSLATGIAGSVLIAAYGILGPDYYSLHQLGKLLLLQGMFLGLIVGMGGLVLPLLTRGIGPPDGAATARDRSIRIAHAAASLALAASFWIEIYQSLRVGLALRGLLVLVLLLATGSVWKTPTVPGWHRWLVWLSSWLIPAGYALAAAFPAQKKAGLHVVFIGGFALMALSVGLHVMLSHGSGGHLVRGRPWQVPLYGGLLLVAIVCRGLVDFDQTRFFLWIVVSAGSFLVGSLVWASLGFPWMGSGD